MGKKYINDYNVVRDAVLLMDEENRIRLLEESFNYALGDEAGSREFDFDSSFCGCRYNSKRGALYRELQSIKEKGITSRDLTLAGAVFAAILEIEKAKLPESKPTFSPEAFKRVAQHLSDAANTKLTQDSSSLQARIGPEICRNLVDNCGYSMPPSDLSMLYKK